jgi:hypothetical protein
VFGIVLRRGEFFDFAPVAIQNGASLSTPLAGQTLAGMEKNG